MARPSAWRSAVSNDSASRCLSFEPDLQRAVARADLIQENGPERIDFKPGVIRQRCQTCKSGRRPRFLERILPIRDAILDHRRRSRKVSEGANYYRIAQQDFDFFNLVLVAGRQHEFADQRRSPRSSCWNLINCLIPSQPSERNF